MVPGMVDAQGIDERRWQRAVCAAVQGGHRVWDVFHNGCVRHELTEARQSAQCLLRRLEDGVEDRILSRWRGSTDARTEHGHRATETAEMNRQNVFRGVVDISQSTIDTLAHGGPGICSCTQRCGDTDGAEVNRRNGWSLILNVLMDTGKRVRNQLIPRRERVAVGGVDIWKRAIQALFQSGECVGNVLQWDVVVHELMDHGHNVPSAVVQCWQPANE